MPDAERLIAVDVGNSRVKLGLFERPVECEQAALAAPLPIAGPPLPEPVDTFDFTHIEGEPTSYNALREWLGPYAGAAALVASVHRSAGQSTLEALRACGLDRCKPLVGRQLPIEVRVEQPERVGVDRLLAGVAANRLRRADAPAIVIDLGTAITIDLIAADGAFEGGAILPGIRMASRALHDQTDALPDVAMQQLEHSPDAVGKTTDAALRAGLFWGAVGAIREVVARQRDRLTVPPQLYLTGGAAPSVARLLAEPDCTVRYLPNLVLSGVAIAAESLAAQQP
ncbi:Type III pantothenate kinase [Posidoniimonas corsicana]|uniref:Type III pantothenate kinase n=1 Tax=Posidoniimonas corsicana TaxID=1938618 RepID=A0A5C5V111_9BACT|nr:type III pantothenate kinase [Posidoniimonas corsicana]TWT32314.1 Type III pantothenate kinase [Posidoniimonas corsicana]